MKYKTEWDLTHIYKGDIKKLVTKDLAVLKKAYQIFAKKYRKNKKHLKNASALAKAIEEYERVTKKQPAERPFLYFWYRRSLNSEDGEAQAQIAKLTEFYANLTNEIEFFILEIGKIPQDLQAKFLKSKELKPFKYFLTKIFRNARYYLSESEEKIMNLKQSTSHSMWVSGFGKLLSKQMVKFKGKEIPYEEARAKLQSLPQKERGKLNKEIIDMLKSVSDFAESEMNAVVTNKKIGDDLRGFKLPYEATVLGYENDLKTVEELNAAVKANWKIAHRFFRIKTKILGYKKMDYVDRVAEVGKLKVKIPIEKAVQKTIEAFKEAGSDFADFVEQKMNGGFVDVYPRKGKRGGAFCSWGSGSPVYIFLNHTDDFRSMTTLAHEMGHGIHATLSRSQRPLYEDVTIATAEVASTFFENLIFDAAIKTASPEEKLILLHDKITEDMNSIFRQIACFNFEIELHQTIREKGFLPKEKIAELMSKHMQTYVGPGVKVSVEDGYSFVSWPHIRNFFYVYSYAFGQLISTALYQRYKEDKSKIKDVIQFLSAGGSDSPENIFRSIGINPNKQFFEKGLKKIEGDIAELERLWQKQQRLDRN